MLEEILFVLKFDDDGTTTLTISVAVKKTEFEIVIE
jgi:hypothetical protein